MNSLIVLRRQPLIVIVKSGMNGYELTMSMDEGNFVTI